MNKQEFINIMHMTQAPLVNMVKMVPEDKLEWRPAENMMSMGQLLKHLSENWCIIRMMVTNDWPGMDLDKMEEMMKLENLPSCGKTEALEAMTKDLNDAVVFVEKEIGEEDFFTKEISAPWGFKGETWKGVLMARDHLNNHKMQLHVYLKILGLPVNTSTLYGM